MRKTRDLHNIKAPVCAILLVIGILLTACQDASSKTTVVLTTGFNKDELFKVEDKICTKPEAMIYLLNIQNQYRSVYGADIFKVNAQGTSLADTIKDNVLADLSQIKAMNVLADNTEVELTPEEFEKAQSAGIDYFASMSSYERAYTGATESIVIDMYSEYARADKLYKELIKDINPEISDDEARTITVKHILIKTYSTDSSGAKKEFSDHAKADALERAERIYAMATDGEHDFEDLVMRYSEGDKQELSFGKDTMDPIFEKAAFELGNGEISPIITTKYGYHIIQCINTFNREETDLNKLRITEKEKEKVFEENYYNFAETLLTDFNDELWETIKITDDENINTQSFFEIYHSYFNEGDE